jgi:hypothetical protein
VIASVARRIAQAAAIVFLVATATFVLLQLAPGDPFSPQEESSRVPPSVIEQHRRNFGLDQPIHNTGATSASINPYTFSTGGTSATSCGEISAIPSRSTGRRWMSFAKSSPTR